MPGDVTGASRPPGWGKMEGVKRTITGQAGTRRMTLGDLRQFLASIENVPDEATLRARVTIGRQLRSVTVEEDDIGFADYVRAVAPEEAGEAPEETTDKRKAGTPVTT
jgi:hypothetical protein